MAPQKPRGVVAAGDPQTAEAGVQLLRAGGNAIDAAVAAAFAAFVCELPLCSPLGGGALLAELPGEAPRALDLFARAPGLGASRPPSFEFDDVEVSFGAAKQLFHVGRGSAAVPLALRGLLQAHRRWGRRPLADVLAPAIQLGRSGWVLSPGVAFVFRILTPIVERTAACRALFADRGAIASAGARLTNPDLARTLETLARDPGMETELLRALARELAPSRGGLFSEEDVAHAQVAEHEPVVVHHGAWRLATMPGPSTGGALVALGLRLLEGIGTTEFLSAEHLLGVARAQEILLAERERCHEQAGRPEAVRALLDEARIARLRTSGPSERPAPDNPLGSTTHVSVLDGEGGAVALTLTNGEGSGHVLPGTGMVINNLLGEEDIHPRGFHCDPPGSPLSTMMAPTLLRRGADQIALGSGGSNRLRNAILQVLVGVLEHDVDPERAVAAARLQLEANDGLYLAFESHGLAPGVVRALLDAYPRGPVVFDAPNLYFGGVHIAVSRAGRFGGAGDPRRSGAIAHA